MTLSETDVQVVETPTPVVETPQETAASRQFAQLARQTKQLRAQQQRLEQEYKAKEAALIAREEAIKVQVQPDLSKYIPRDRLKSDPLGVLAEAEVTYEQLTQQELDRQNINPSVMNTINELRNEIKALKQVNEDGKKASVDSQQAQYKAAVKQITMDAKALIKSDPVAYEAISKTGTVKEVVKLIEDTYAKDGVLLSVEEAAQEVENYLVDENFKMATRIDKIKKRLGQVAPGSTSTQNRTTETQQPQRPGMKTLTNATSSTRQLSARERAIAAFEGKNR